MNSVNNSSPHPVNNELAHLQLLHLADSALPIGSLSHSLGLETLVAAEMLQVNGLSDFLRGYLEEAGLLEAVACREGFHLLRADALAFDASRWLALNELLNALKLARESREASATLGRNFLQTVLRVGDFPALAEAWHASRLSNGMVHHSAAFGLVSGAMGFDENGAVLAYLHQLAMSLISACQRLLPLGQNAATRIGWGLKPAIVAVAESSRGKTLDSVNCATPLPDWGSMEHPALSTRLFIS